MSDPKNISDRQLALLCDLLALQQAGLISDATTEYVEVGYDAGTSQVDIPATVTWEGAQVVADFIKSGKTIQI